MPNEVQYLYLLSSSGQEDRWHALSSKHLHRWTIHLQSPHAEWFDLTERLGFCKKMLTMKGVKAAVGYLDGIGAESKEVLRSGMLSVALVRSAFLKIRRGLACFTACQALLLTLPQQNPCH